MHARRESIASWQKPGLFILSFLALLAAACTSVSLVSPYDEQTEQGLSALYIDTTKFVDQMIAQHVQPGGTYAANQQFYSDAMARVDVMIARSETTSLRPPRMATRTSSSQTNSSGVS